MASKSGFKCELCNKAWMKESTVKEHIKKVHGENEVLATNIRKVFVIPKTPKNSGLGKGNGGASAKIIFQPPILQKDHLKSEDDTNRNTNVQAKDDIKNITNVPAKDDSKDNNVTANLSNQNTNLEMMLKIKQEPKQDLKRKPLQPLSLDNATSSNVKLPHTDSHSQISLETGTLLNSSYQNKENSLSHLNIQATNKKPRLGQPKLPKNDLSKGSNKKVTAKLHKKNTKAKVSVNPVESKSKFSYFNGLKMGDLTISGGVLKTKEASTNKLDEKMEPNSSQTSQSSTSSMVRPEILEISQIQTENEPPQIKKTVKSKKRSRSRFHCGDDSCVPCSILENCNKCEHCLKKGLRQKCKARKCLNLNPRENKKVKVTECFHPDGDNAEDTGVQELPEDKVEHTGESHIKELPEDKVDHTGESHIKQLPGDKVDHTGESLIKQLPGDKVDHTGESHIKQLPGDKVEHTVESHIKDIPGDKVEHTGESHIKELPEDKVDNTGGSHVKELPEDKLEHTGESRIKSILDELLVTVTAADKKLIKRTPIAKRQIYSCGKCGKLYKQFKSKQDHQKKCKGILKVKLGIVCQVCRHTLSDNSSLKRHMKLVHEKLKNPSPTIQCELCELSLANKNQLKEHMASVHGVNNDDEQEMKMCPIEGCDFQHKKKAKLKEHVTKQHGDKLEKLKCTICPYECLSQAGLNRHLRTIHIVTTTESMDEIESLDETDKNSEPSKEDDEIEENESIEHVEYPNPINDINVDFDLPSFVNDESNIDKSDFLSDLDKDGDLEKFLNPGGSENTRENLVALNMF